MGHWVAVCASLFFSESVFVSPDLGHEGMTELFCHGDDPGQVTTGINLPSCSRKKKQYTSILYLHFNWTTMTSTLWCPFAKIFMLHFKPQNDSGGGGQSQHND